jgi:hypothetical protein
MFPAPVARSANPIRVLAREGRGQWRFDAGDDDDGATQVTWTSTFDAGSRGAAVVLAPVVRRAWRAFMRRGLDRLAAPAR